MVTITHTHESGTMIEGTARGDGSAEVLKANGWRWGRSIGSWFIPSSRDRLPQTWKIQATARALEAAGFAVELEISTELRDMAEVEAGKIERQAARVEALDAKAERKADASAAADAKARADFDRLPWGGEPIKIGHHSEGRHRNAIARADRSMGASVAASEEADRAAYRAEIAAHTTDARYNPATVARRVEKLEADGRKLERSLAANAEAIERRTKSGEPDRVAAIQSHSERLALMLEENRGQVAYWRGVRAEQIADGKAGDYSPETIRKGDLVKFRFDDAAIVTRVSPKSVSVVYWPRWDQGRMNGGTIPYGDLTGHTVPTDEQRAELLAKAKAGNDATKAARIASLRSLGVNA